MAKCVLMNVSKKLLFFDIDGTLWDMKNRIPESTKEAFAKLHENGHLTFLCSGRSRGYIQHPDLFALGFDGVVSACGTAIEYKGQLVYLREIDNDLLAKTIDTVRSYGFKPILEGFHALYLERCEFEGDPFFAKLEKDLGDDFLSIDEHRGRWHACKFSCDTTDCDTASCFKELEADYDFLVHNERVVEVVPKGFDKSTGIEWLVDYLHADMNDTFAFGDSINDAGMLKAVGCGIAMGNATDDVKKIADYVTTPMKEDGIYRACQHFALI